MHEVNTGAAGSNPGRWLLASAWRRRVMQGAMAGPPAPTKRILAASRLIIVFTALVIVATVLSASVGYRFAHQSDERLTSEQHAAVRNAVSEMRSPFSPSAEIDPHIVRIVEQTAGVNNLKFERDPNTAGRETRPAMNADGRIEGFFTWDTARPMMLAISRLAPLVVAINLLLVERDDDDWTTFALIELDGMEDVTANHGVLGSDELIVAVAKRLKESLPSPAMCGRIASDEFAVTLTSNQTDDAEAIIRAALETISRPHWIDTVVRVSAHAGFAQAPRHATTRGELTRRADLALRAAARRGPGAVIMFDLSIDTVSTDQKFIHRELPRAISANELEVHYQPIVSSHGGRMVGVEALLRWTHATRGMIPPATFIPVAEQMGLMDTIGAFVLRRALQEAKRWPDDLYVAVNLSPLQVRDRTIVDLVRSALAESAIAPSRLVLEITEGVLIDNPDEMVKRIKDLHSLGVRVALDDFGSGYSNLGYLQRFPLDKLKIDKSFVAALGRSANGGVIIQAIVALGRALGLSVLVEGVETEHQRVLLRLAGCDEMQGFLFAKPAPAKAIDKLLAQAKQGGKALPAPGETLTA